RDAETVAKLNGVSLDDLERCLAAGRKKLLVVRAGRVPPMRDDKILSAWNGLMIAAMARGFRVLDEPRYRDSAVRAAEFVLKHLRRQDGRLLRTYRAGKAHTLGYLNDHAFLIEGLLNLYETTGEPRWLNEAVALNDDLRAYFADEAGGYFFTARDAEKLLVRNKDASDGAIPSGNSVQLMNLLRLAVLLDDKKAGEQAEKLMRCFAGTVQRSVFAAERMLAAVDFHHRRPREIAFVVPPDRKGLAELEAALWKKYVPNKVVAFLPYGSAQAAALQKQIPLLAGKTPLDGRTTVYVCENFACQAPTVDPDVFVKQLHGS
ncbi:MAG: thioredoxin domain-containing protein, partial [Phycisphaerae bacterium]